MQRLPLIVNIRNAVIILGRSKLCVKIKLLHILRRVRYWVRLLKQCSVKESTCQCRKQTFRDTGLIPESGSFPGGRNATQASILARRIPWTEEPGRLQSVWPQYYFCKLYCLGPISVLDTYYGSAFALSQKSTSPAVPPRAPSLLQGKSAPSPTWEPFDDLRDTECFLQDAFSSRVN